MSCSEAVSIPAGYVRSGLRRINRREHSVKLRHVILCAYHARLARTGDFQGHRTVRTGSFNEALAM
jgi:hypothetical protein